jgi:hypothetical protein
MRPGLFGVEKQGASSCGDRTEGWNSYRFWVSSPLDGCALTLPTPPLGLGILVAAALHQVKREAEALEVRASRKKYQDFESTAVFARHKHDIVKVDRVGWGIPAVTPNFLVLTELLSSAANINTTLWDAIPQVTAASRAPSLAAPFCLCHSYKA